MWRWHVVLVAMRISDVSERIWMACGKECRGMEWIESGHKVRTSVLCCERKEVSEGLRTFPFITGQWSPCLSPAAGGQAGGLVKLQANCRRETWP